MCLLKLYRENCTLADDADDDDNNDSVTMCVCQLHECFCRVCRLHAVADVPQSEFLGLCQNVEAQGIFSLKKTRDTRSTKVHMLQLYY